jgi:MFS family permease
MPIWGRLADQLGSRPANLAGFAVFLLGSALAGLSRSMEQLIAFRAVQGLLRQVQPALAQAVGGVFAVGQMVAVAALVSGLLVPVGQAHDPAIRGERVTSSGS